MAKIPIAAARVAKGLTQKDLADKLGVSSQLVWEWENTNKFIVDYLNIYQYDDGLSQLTYSELPIPAPY